MLDEAPPESVTVTVISRLFVTAWSKETSALSFNSPVFEISNNSASFPERLNVPVAESTSIKLIVPILAPKEFSSTVRAVSAISDGASFTAVTIKVKVAESEPP